MNSDVNLLRSLVHNQLSWPRYINIFKQGWFKSNYNDKKPEKFDNPAHVGKYDRADNRPKLAMLAANVGYRYWTDDRSRLG